MGSSSQMDGRTDGRTRHKLPWAEQEGASSGAATRLQTPMQHWGSRAWDPELLLALGTVTAHPRMTIAAAMTTGTIVC